MANTSRTYPTLVPTASKLRGDTSAGLPSKIQTDMHCVPPFASPGAMLISVPGIEAQMRILRQGWLYKRGPFYQPWRRRWCVVAKHEKISFRLEQSGSAVNPASAAVFVFYSQRDHVNGVTPPKGKIVLAVQLEVQVPTNSVKKTFLDRNTLYPFIFVIQGRRHVFAASNRKDREDWIHLVQSMSDSPFSVPKPVPCSEGGSVGDAESILDNGSSTNLSRNRDPSIYSQLAFSIKADLLSLADVDVLTAMELSEVGQRPSSILTCASTSNGPNHPWNDVYQRLCDQPCPSHHAQVQRDLALADLLGQFNELAKSLAAQIVDAYHTQSTQGTESWVFGNVVVSMAADYTNPDPAVVRTAVRRAGHELSGTSVISSIESDLHTPLMCLVDYKGFRLVCSAAVPLSQDETLVLDTSKGKADPSALEKLAEAFLPLNLAELSKPCAPFLTQGHSCVKIHYAHSHDHYYVTNLSEMFPVDHPKPERPLDPARRLRPEFVASYKHALSPTAACLKTDDASMKTCHPELADARKEVMYAARYLRDTHIMDFVSRLDRLELLPCDSIGLSECLHSHGINIRYLGLIATRTRLPAVKEQCLIEMVARAAKDVFQSRIRNHILNFRRIGATKIDSELARVAVELLNLTLGADQKTWDDLIKPVLQLKFSFVMSHDIFAALHRPALIRSIQYHWSIEIEEIDQVDGSPGDAITMNDFRGFCARPKVITPKKSGRNHLTTSEDRAAFDLSQHLSLCGPHSKLVACPITQRRLIAVARAALSCGRPSDAVKYATAATRAGPWKKSCGTARAWAVLAEVAWVINQENSDKTPDTTKVPSSRPPMQLQSSTKVAGSSETLVASRATSSAALTSAAAVAGLRPASELTKNGIDAVTVHWGQDHPLVIDIHSRLAKCAEPHSPSKALDHHARSLRASIRSLGRTHPVTARVQLAACVLLLTQGRAQEAARMGQDALSSLDKDSFSLERALAYSVMAEAQGVLGDLAVARKNAATCRSLREQKLGWSHPLTADACAQVAALAVQSAALPEYHEAEIITSAARADVLAAVEAYGRVFKYLKSNSSTHLVGVSRASKMKSSASHPSDQQVADPVVEMFDDFTPLSWLVLNGSDHWTPELQTTTLLRLPSIISPPGLPANTCLLKLAKTLIGLKLRVLPPNHHQHVRVARRRPHIGMTEEAMRDIMARLVGLTPAVFLDDCLGRADDGDSEAIDELAIVIALSEKKN